MGQYGGVTQDIYERLSPYVVNQSLNYPAMLDQTIEEAIQLIRGKLMP